MSEEISVKPARAVNWRAVDDGQAVLVARCVAGDEVACAELVDEHQRMVYQLAIHLLGDHNEALDLSQEVFLRVFRTLDRFGGRSTLRTWIYRIVINQARNRMRWWRRRRRGDQVSLDDFVRERGDLPETRVAASPDRVFRQKELAQRLQQALDRLPFDQKTAIVLREVEGLSYEEIGDSLGVALGTVRSRLARARETLRAELRDA